MVVDLACYEGVAVKERRPEDIWKGGVVLHIFLEHT